MSLYDWSKTALDNATADLAGSGINWQEGQLPSTVNNSARAMMMVLAQWRDDHNGSLVTGGSGGAYTISTNTPFTTLSIGRSLVVKAHAATPGVPTINVNTTGVVEIRSASGDQLGKSSIRTGEVLALRYDGTYWRIESKSINPLFAGGRYVSTVGGSANAITLTTGAALAGLEAGMTFHFKPVSTSTGAATIAVDGLAAVNAKRPGGSSTAAYDFVAGTLHTIVYDGTNFIATGAPAASADVLARILSVGDVILTTSATARAGFVRLKETSQSLLKTDYPELNTYFSGQGYPFGSTATHFSVPPAAGYGLRFAASNSTVDPSGPRAAGSTQSDSFASHTHTASGTASASTTGDHTHTGTTNTTGNHTHSVPNGGNTITNVTTSGSQTAVGTSAQTTGSDGSHSHTLTINATGDHTHTITVDSVTVNATGSTETRGKNVAFHADMLARPAEAAATATGTYGLTYKWSAGTSGDPTSGFLGINNATPSSATELRISDTDGLGADVNSLLNLWDDGSGSIRCTLILAKIGAPSQYIAIGVNAALTDHGTYKSFPVTYIANSGTFTAGDNLAVSFFLSMGGAAGADGFFTGSEPIETTIAGADYLFFSDTDAAGAGKRITFTDLGIALGVGGTNLGTTRDSVQVDVTSSTGTDIVLAAATTALAGVMTAADKTKLDGIATGANLYVHPNHTGDVTSVADGAQTIANDAVSNAKLANMATATFKGRTTAGTGDPEDLTGTQATTLLDALVGDSGSGGTKGLAPAPAAGDAAAGKFLKADGLWAVPSGGGGVSDGDKGDITVTSSGTVWTIDNDVVTYAKMQNVGANSVPARAAGTSGDLSEVALAASQLLGRGASGDVAAITLGTGLSMSGATLNASGGGVSDGDKTDITVTSSGSVWTIDNDVVTFAKMQNIATDRLLGRDTAATGDVEELTVSGGIEFTGAGGIQTTAFTGDVTKTGGGTALTIANDAVTFAKLQNIATDRLLGRDTAATGDPEEIAVNGGLEFGGAGNIQRSALTGDVTASAGSNATTIANNAVSDAKLRDSAALSVIGRSANSTGDPADIAAAADFNVLRRSGTSIGFGAIDLSQAGAVTGDLAYSNLAQGSARSVLGVTGNATADNASIQGTADQVLVVNGAGTALAFGTVATAGITADAVTYAKIQNAAANTIIARAAGTSGDVGEVAIGASQLAGRGSTGDIAPITLGSGLSMSGTTLSSTGGGGTAVASDPIIDGAFETTTTTGTGNITLAGAVTNYQTINAVIGTDVYFEYDIRGSGTEWETGIGYLSGSTTLVRERPIEGSAGDETLVNFSAGTKNVMITITGYGQKTRSRGAMLAMALGYDRR